ncbi:class I SAM-dependent methyltransferase [Paenibacillus rigui]|uniref:Methylase n=1 Tax=Paenibacillus rigui TaxID=554312 RepID=A0A229UL15_9BACL|nr:methyltransferase domain-containing protein [Paenibacillus rigui]OXM84147.1 methylase [Paenibacillus rigui]
MNEKIYMQTGVAMTCRSYAEYERMFALKPEHLSAGAILDVASGASSFVAEACRMGYDAHAADPLYAMDTDEIIEQGRKEIDVSTAKLAGIQDVFDWTFYGSLERHRSLREASMHTFAGHMRESGVERYVSAKLPELPFNEHSFALVLCSHFLFLYQDQFDEQFHLDAIRELIRVCRPGGQVRIYPLLSLQWVRYPQLERLMQQLSQDGIRAELIASELPFIPGSTELLCLTK